MRIMAVKEVNLSAIKKMEKFKKTQESKKEKK